MHYSLNTTNKCDWDCKYCIVDVHNQPIKPIEEVLKDLDTVTSKDSLSFAGGEPGMLSKSEVALLFDKLKIINPEHIELLTNGLFIKKHPEFLHLIDSIDYHCVDSLKDEIQFPDLDNEYVEYVIVVTEEEYLLLDEFLERYKNIPKFNIIGSRDVQPMSMKTKLKMVMKYKDRMTDNSLKVNLSPECNSLGY